LKIAFSEGSFTSDDVVKFLSISGQSTAIFSEVIKNKMVLKKAGELGLEASDDDLQKFADIFREMRGLYSAEETIAFLESNGLTEDDFEQFCEVAVLTEMLKDHLCTEEKMQEYFVNNRASLDAAMVSIIVVENENLANEIKMQIEEDGEDFHKLAREHSVDANTKYAGGYAGIFLRDSLPPEISAKVFNAQDGELLGPFVRDGVYQLILVERVMKAELSDEVKQLIRERVFAEWLSQYLKDGTRIE
jgi:peptidylprolyl isomerase